MTTACNSWKSRPRTAPTASCPTPGQENTVSTITVPVNSDPMMMAK